MRVRCAQRCAICCSMLWWQLSATWHGLRRWRRYLRSWVEGGGCRAEIGENAATLEAWGLAGGLDPSKGDFQFGENTEELVSDVSEGNGGLLSGVGSRVCYAVYGPRIVCDNNNVVRDESSVCLPVDQDELRHGSCRFNARAAMRFPAMSVPISLSP